MTRSVEPRAVDARAAVLAALASVAPELDPATVDPDDDLRDQCDLDSIDFLTFVERLGAAVGVTVPERDYPSLASVAMAVAYLDARTAGS